MAGRATRLVSSRNTRVLEKGIAYRNVGSFQLAACSAGSVSRWSSRQSMNCIVSISKGWDSTSQMMPYAPWNPGSKGAS